MPVDEIVEAGVEDFLDDLRISHHQDGLVPEVLALEEKFKRGFNVNLWYWYRYVDHNACGKKKTGRSPV